MPVGVKGFVKGVVLFKGESHPNWKGGKPKCKACGKQLVGFYTKLCRKCYFENYKSTTKGLHIQTNTGRTHFKKGFIPWNKGLKTKITKKMILSHIRKKGVSLRKPDNFSETMRKVNPPRGRKIQYHGSCKEERVWRKGYVMVYKPSHPSSRKSPPDYGYIPEHRMAIEDNIGRSLKKDECVHHVDGDKSNNAIENLILCKNSSDHIRIHSEMGRFVEELIRSGKVHYEKETKKFTLR